MSYLGNTPTTQNFISGTDYFNGTGAQTAFTLSRTVNSVNDIQVTVNNVVQQPNDAYTLSGTTLTMTSAPSAGTNNVYVRYLSTTTQAITPSQGTVSWSTLDSNIQQDLGVMYKNRIINGNMVIDQRNAGASVTPSANQYLVDRWQAATNVSSKFSVQQSTTAPAGFNYSMLVTSLSAYSIGAAELCAIRQSIEGYNIADLGLGTASAKTFTISFWVRSSLTGTFGGSLMNGAADYSYPFTYTISAANTFEYKSVTVTGATAGTWLTTNGIGLSVLFGLGVGSTFSGTAGSWSANGYYGATGATSIVGTNGATWYLTGVQLEVGTQATAFSTAGGSYGAELALCQRYAYRIGYDDVTFEPYGSGFWQSTTRVPANIQFPVTMRAQPTAIYGTAASFFVSAGGTNIALSAISSDVIGKATATVACDVSSGGTTGQGSRVFRNANFTNAYMIFSAEL